ncbi:MAG: HAMP domain-containing sensor histidine kinase [Variovorax sp.]
MVANHSQANFASPRGATLTRVIGALAARVGIVQGASAAEGIGMKFGFRSPSSSSSFGGGSTNPVWLQASLPPSPLQAAGSRQAMDNTANAEKAEAWIRGELIRELMNATRGTNWVSATLLPAVVALGWNSTVPHWVLLFWLGLGIAATLARNWVERLYQSDYASGDESRQHDFVRRFGMLWNCNGLIWGASVLLLFDRISNDNQFVAWLILGGVVTFTATGMALYLPLLKQYLAAVFLTLLLAIGLRVPVNGFDNALYLCLFMVLACSHWRLLYSTGASAYKIHLHNQRLIGSLTQQRQAAEAAVTVKNRFLASAAHDMRQPVLALSLYADWLCTEPDQVPEIAPKIVRATHAINALFDSLFDLGRIDAGQVRLQIVTIDLDQLLGDLDVQYRPAAEAKGLEFRVHSFEGAIRSDAVRVRRVIGNLLANAIKYTETGGVLLAARRRGDHVCIEVWDTGIGIAREHLTNVFQEFFKVPDHAGTSDGFGLGLAIVARMSHALGHPISVRSRLGKGSMFRVDLIDADPVEAQARITNLGG